MVSVGEISQFILDFAPSELAEEWDNVGLLVGDPDQPVTRAMTCLTITPESASEAVQKKANVIVTHHPLPFRAMKRLTTADTASRLLLQLIKADVAVISPHTAFDSAARGINTMLAERFGIGNIRPLIPSIPLGEEVGAARIGTVASGTTFRTLMDTAKASFDLPTVRFVGSPDQNVSQVALCCGSGGSFLDKAISAGCDALVTGEATFHTCLEARANNVAMLLLGHHASERFAVENLAKIMTEAFSQLEIWASESETDPVQSG